MPGGAIVASFQGLAQGSAHGHGDTGYDYTGNNPIVSSDPTGLLATQQYVNPHFRATAADLKRECNEGNEVTCEDWGLMPAGDDAKPKTYASKKEAGTAALIQIRRMQYSRYGGRVPGTNFREMGGRLYRRGPGWTFTRAVFGTSTQVRIGTQPGSASDENYHSHPPYAAEGNNPRGPSTDETQLRNAAGQPAWNSIYLLSPDGQMLHWDRRTMELGEALDLNSGEIVPTLP